MRGVRVLRAARVHPRPRHMLPHRCTVKVKHPVASADAQHPPAWPPLQLLLLLCLLLRLRLRLLLLLPACGRLWCIGSLACWAVPW